MSTYFPTSSVSFDKKNSYDNNGTYFELLSFWFLQTKSYIIVKKSNLTSKLSKSFDFFDSPLAADI